jgi:hypothetical protein
MLESINLNIIHCARGESIQMPMSMVSGSNFWKKKSESRSESFNRLPSFEWLTESFNRLPMVDGQL